MGYGNKVGYPLASTGLYTDIDTTQRNVLGQVEKDDSGNEFIYLKGVASLVAGDFVVYDGTYATTRAVNTPVTGPVAMACAAVLANQYGWFQIGGVTPATANIATDASGSGKPLFLSATAGRLTTTVAAGNAVLGSWAKGNPASNAGAALLNRPFAPGFTLASA